MYFLSFSSFGSQLFLLFTWDPNQCYIDKDWLQNPPTSQSPTLNWIYLPLHSPVENVGTIIIWFVVQYLLDLIWSFFPDGTSGKEPACQCRGHKRHSFNLWVGKILWRREWQPTLVFLPRESHRQKSLGSQRVGYDSAHMILSSRILFSDTVKSTEI